MSTPLQPLWRGAASALFLVIFTTNAWAQSTDPTPQSDLEEDDAAPQAPIEMEFLDADGNPLPPEVQEQLREQFRLNPPRFIAEDGSIVVRRERPRGSVQSDVLPDRVLSPIEITAYGAATIQDLLEALGPQLETPGSLNDAPPLLLLNGRRVPNPADVARIPTEAIERVEILPEAIALQYGLESDAKVVNVITFERFRTVFNNVSATVPTEGGGGSASVGAELFRIDGDTRLGFGANVTQVDELLEADRNLSQPADVTEIGKTRTLLPSVERYVIYGNIGRPLGQNTSASLTGRYRQERSNGLAGSLGDFLIERADTVEEYELGTSLSSQLGQYLLAFNAAYSDRTNTTNLGSSAVSDDVSTLRIAQRDLLADINMGGTLASMNAGDLLGSLFLEARTSELAGFATYGLENDDSQRSRHLAGFAANLEIPVLPMDSAFGRVLIRTNIGYEYLSDTENTRRFANRIDWNPVSSTTVGVSFTQSERAPSLEELSSPSFLTPNVRVFDYVLGTTVDVEYLSGGNSSLVNEDRRDIQLFLRTKPLADSDLLLAAAFASSRIEMPIARFPLLTETTAGAFPDRFARDTNGSLSLIDIRPLNFNHSWQERLFWGVSYTRPLGPVPQNDPSSGRVFSSEEEAREAFPDDLVMTVSPNSSLAQQAESLSSRFFFNLYHTWFTRDEVELARGTSPLNLLVGDAVDFLGGRRRHRIEFDAGLYKDGFGVRTEMEWASSTSLRVQTPSGSDELRFDSFGRIDLRFFADLGSPFSPLEVPNWLRGTRVTLSFDNLLNNRQEVFSVDGSTPLGYQGPYLDPLGRTITFNVRKRF